MSNAKQKPIYRVKFCRVVGSDEAKKDQLGKAVEIGAVWARREASKGAILKLDIVPQDLSSGVVFLDPIDAQTRGFA